jgi:hypothetical protein
VATVAAMGAATVAIAEKRAGSEISGPGALSQWFVASRRFLFCF